MSLRPEPGWTLRPEAIHDRRLQGRRHLPAAWSKIAMAFKDINKVTKHVWDKGNLVSEKVEEVCEGEKSSSDYTLFHINVPE